MKLVEPKDDVPLLAQLNAERLVQVMGEIRGGAGLVANGIDACVWVLRDARCLSERGVSSSESESSPWPEYSTNLPTTPFLRSICVTVSTRSVAVTPSEARR